MPIHILKIFVAILSAGVLAGCSTSQQQPQQPATQQAPIAQSIVQQARNYEGLLLAGLVDAMSGAPKDEPVFVSLRSLGNDPFDPPTNVTASLALRRKGIYPASHGEFRSTASTFRGIFHCETGERGSLCWAVVKERLSDTIFRLELGHWHGMLNSQSEDAIFELQNGLWVKTKSLSYRVS